MNIDHVKLLDLCAQHAPIKNEILEAITRVIDSQQFILGTEVSSLESELAPYVGCKHSLGVTSGSDALLMALMVLDLKPGDEVITSPYTFFATVGAISRLGLTPVFVDIDPKTYNIDAQKIKITPRTKVIMPVHLFGQSSDMAPIMKAIAGTDIKIIEDAAQALGTEYQGQRSGSIGHIGCFSFFPSKNLGAMGDAGLVSTNDDALAEKLKIFRAHGSKPKYYHKYVGGNFRIDALQAAILRVKFKYLDTWTQARQKNAQAYDVLFKDANLTQHIGLPWRREGDRAIFNQYIIRTTQRDALKKHLADHGVQTEVYYPVSMHMQECFSYLGYKEGDFPESEAAAKETLAIPIYPELTLAEQEYVVATIKKFF